MAEGLKVNFSDVFLGMYIWSFTEGFYEREIVPAIYVYTFPWVKKNKKSVKIFRVNRQEVCPTDHISRA